LAVQKYPENPRAYLCLGEAYYNVGELNLAYENLKKAERLANNKGDKEDLMYIYNQIGQTLYEMGYKKTEDILSYYNEGLNLIALGDTNMQATLLSNIATIYSDKGIIDKALYCFRSSLSLEIDEKRKAYIYNNIGMFYIECGNDYREAERWFEKAIEIGDGDYHVISIAKLNLGDAYRREGDYENAKKYLSEGLEDVKKVGDKYWMAKGYFYLGVLYESKGDVKTAKEYYTRAYNLFKSIGAEGDAQYTLKKCHKKINQSSHP
jgi:tetratricopeptide (TPR) repeat protein